MHTSTSISALVNKISIVPDEFSLQDLFATIKPGAVKASVKIAFVNAHAFNMCYRDSAFLNDLLGCDYVFRDGTGMKILYKLLGRDPGLNLNGTDLIPRILELYKGCGVALMGTDFPALGHAAEKIRAMGLDPSVVLDGFQEDQVYIKSLNASVPLVVLAMGMPKQERVARIMSEQVSFPCLIVCGGAILDFIGEKVKRAPAIYRRLGMEWAYRLIQEPRRLFRRYIIGNAVFVCRALFLACKAKYNSKGTA